LDYKIPLFRIYWDENDVNAVSEVIRRGSQWAEGPEIKQFEEKLAEYLNAKYVTTFNSGTSAMHAALLAMDIKDKEVIVPSLTFISTVNTVVLAGGKPVFAEVEADTYGLDVRDVESKITDKTAAIFPVHYAGAIARDTRALQDLAEEKKLLLVEDAAEALGAKANKRMAGTFGDAGMFSFCQNKIVATGEGGAIATEKQALAKKLRLIRSHGRVEGRDGYFESGAADDYELPGYNYRMPPIISALGMSQLGKVEKLIEMRREKASYLNKALGKVQGLKVPKEIEGNRNVYQLYTIEIEGNRDILQKHLADSGIASKVYFGPVHLKTLYRKNFGCKEGMLPFTEGLGKRLLSLPFWPGISKEEMDAVAESIKSFFKEG